MCSLRNLWSLVFGFSLLVGSGCTESSKTDTAASSAEHAHSHDDHGHHHGPESLKEAISQLTSMRDTIRDGFAKNDQDAAHDPLHEVGHVLEAMPELAKTEKVSAKDQAAIEKAVNSLMDAFGRVDKTMHGQEGSTYSEESATIDATLITLSQACGIESAAVEAPATNTVPDETSATDPPVEATPAPAAESEITPEPKSE